MARFFRFSIFFPAFALFLGLPISQAQVINEYVANHTNYSGTDDDHEFVEIYGSPSTDYSSLTILSVEGDTSTSTGTIGYIDKVYAVGATNASGFWMTSYLTNELENGSMTLLLVEGFTGAAGDDIDADNDGAIDNVLWNSVVDSVAISDGDAGDGHYSSVVLSSAMDDSSYTPGGASRIPNGTDTDAVSDWVRNNYFGDGLPGSAGITSPGEAYNTPGTTNAYIPKPEPKINEFVLDHVGSDDHEYIEVFGLPDTFYTDYRVLVIDGDQEDAGHIDNVFNVGLTAGGGAWTTGFLSDQLEGNSTTLLLVKDFTGAAGDDLDTDNDGNLDSTPWSQMTDAIAVTDGDAGDFAYASVVLDPNFDGAGTAVLGASRFHSGIDTDSAEDWIRNDFDGAGLSGFVGTITSGEAYNTPGLANRVTVEDYYASVDPSTPATLRATLHDAIKDHIRHEYTSSATDVWDILREADLDPQNSNNVITVYKNGSVSKTSSTLNREHTWPKSYGFPDDSTANYPYTDCHHLMMADASYNTSRSNRPYGTCDASCAEYVTQVTNGTGGGSGVYPGNSDWGTGQYSDGIWQTWVGKKGNTARAQFYMDVRYEGGTHGYTNVSEPDLILTDDTSLIEASATGDNLSTAYMGRLSVLLQWTADDPPDAFDQARNEAVYKYQGNRNPFIDHPEWVSCIFQGTGCGGGDTVFADDFETGNTGRWSFASGL